MEKGEDGEHSKMLSSALLAGTLHLPNPPLLALWHPTRSLLFRCLDHQLQRPFPEALRMSGLVPAIARRCLKDVLLLVGHFVSWGLARKRGDAGSRKMGLPISRMVIVPEDKKDAHNVSGRWKQA